MVRILKAIKLEASVPKQLRSERAKLLRQLSSERYAEQAMQQIGKAKQVLTLNK